MKMQVLALILILISPFLINAQKELNFEFDYAKFNNDSSSVYMELYYELNPNGMTLIQSDNGKMIEAIIHLEISNLETKSFIVNKDWKLKNEINPSDSLMKSYSGVLNFIVPKGKYSLFISASDAKDPKLKKTYKETISVLPFKYNKYSISDIQLASNIKREDTDPKSLFYKNTLEVMPNPSAYYSNLSPILFYYSELYNLILSDEKTEFELQKYLVNNSGKIIYSNNKKVKQAKSSVVEIGLINLSKYPTGSYSLVCNLLDPITKQSYMSSKRFYLYNPKVVDSTIVSGNLAGVAGSEFGVYAEADCDKMFNEAKYIASQSEITQYKKLNSLQSKREFLFHFWKIRDTDPTHAKNNFKEEYIKRAEYANQNFGWGKRDGYITDRGRVYLLYGEPDEREYHSSEGEMKSYEVWSYHQIEGGVVFYFGDITGFGNYELLNSTMKGEVSDSDWMSKLGKQ
jgi:GWxTD domain-containing protein